MQVWYNGDTVWYNVRIFPRSHMGELKIKRDISTQKSPRRSPDCPLTEMRLRAFLDSPRRLSRFRQVTFMAFTPTTLLSSSWHEHFTRLNFQESTKIGRVKSSYPEEYNRPIGVKAVVLPVELVYSPGYVIITGLGDSDTICWSHWLPESPRSLSKCYQKHILDS